ncbi:MAG: phage integrase SAM-like domain-containing protein [Bacteroidales bacterium]|nr:phage integrase SAM-like domain-containing protein [Prevotella sp.]MBO7618386.1 phage integrase SAM-like domain-containing protein [Bacteroidales bacterium]
MATIQIEVNKSHKKKDGTIPVEVRITHNRKHCRMKTNLVAYPQDLTRDCKLKGNLKRKAEDLVHEMYDALEDISFFDLARCDVHYVAERIKAKLEPENWSLDFFEFAKEYLRKASITDSTKHTYEVALSALKRYIRMDKLDINDITLPFLEDFAHFLDNEPKYHYDRKLKKTVATKQKKRQGTGAKAYFTKLGHIFNAAKRRYNDEDLGLIRIPRSPFEKGEIKASPSEGQEPLTLKTVHLMIAATPKKESERNAIDLFLLSLGLMGANMADLYDAARPVDEQWDYKRKKTTRRRADKAQMKVMIPECLAPYSTRLSAGAASDRWPNLSKRFDNANYATKGTNDALKAWAKDNGLPGFTFYSARKTWATIAGSKACGIDKALVDECLAHIGSFKMADIKPSSIPVPNYYWKVLMKVKTNSSGNVIGASTIGFWFDHREYESAEQYTSFATSVNDIEAKTGFNLFANLPDAYEDAAEANNSWTAFKEF